jgi:hypothetical protein
MRCISRLTSALGVTLTGVLCACATPIVDGSPATPVAVHVSEERLRSNELEALLGYTETVRLLNPAALQREFLRVHESHAKDASVANRLKLAILLSLRHAPFRDEARARGLLLQTAVDSSYNLPSYRQLAGLLLIGLDERRELERALEEERRQRHVLGKKLEQLKTIEEEIDRRRAPPVMTPRNGSPRTDIGS